MQLGWDSGATPAKEGKGLAKRSWQNCRLTPT